MTNALTVPTQGINAGEYLLVSADSTDERIIEMWLHSGKRGNSTATQDSYLHTWLEFAAFVRRPLQSVTLDALQTWRGSLIGKPATQKRKIATIKSLFAFAVKVGYLRMSPAVMLEAPHVPQNVSAHVVSVVDLARILDATETPLEDTLVRVLYGSGARISELLSLTWEDVTPREDGKGAHLFIASGKGRKTRTVGINGSAYTALLALRGETAQRTDYVFATRNGTAIDRHAAHRLIKKILQRAGVKDAADASCHWLRHSHATHSLQQGANVADVQAQLGHSSLNTTSLYVHSSAYSADKLPF